MKISLKTTAKFDELKKILGRMEKVLIAFSGGVDSTFLVKTASDVLGENVLAVIAVSETYPGREIREAESLAHRLGVRYRLIETKELENPDFAGNPPERCYFCKGELFFKLREMAAAEGIPFVLDGSNYEDLSDFRPGAEAAKEWGVRSPLKEAGLLKREIRQLSRMMNLPTWNKPSLACLSSRFPYHTRIDRKSLEQVGEAEEFLKRLGFGQIRVRHHSQVARIEIEPGQFRRMIQKKTRQEVVHRLKELGYAYITLDLAGYRTGSMNEPLGLKPRDEREDVSGS